jgi:hypothetical protein
MTSIQSCKFTLLDFSESLRFSNVLSRVGNKTNTTLTIWKNNCCPVVVVVGLVVVVVVAFVVFVVVAVVVDIVHLLLMLFR